MSIEDVVKEIETRMAQLTDSMKNLPPMNDYRISLVGEYTALGSLLEWINKK